MAEGLQAHRHAAHVPRRRRPGRRERTRRPRRLVRQDLAGDRRPVVRQGRAHDGRSARAQGRVQGRIVGIEPGTGQMVRLENTVMPAYGLSDFELTRAGTSSMLAEPERAYAKKEPIAVVLWSPHWAYDRYDLTRLADPEKT
ncbi:glycine betaine ABC transporter substrate-binding protein [Streptomyces europaeiscabiei]|nr:glycine betaine ABC transporter substrate-binding protein [Streptomyces europaeiscabiei]MDX3692888.1 glycine betaine ABC transporter substrate-binding protein [Streptomyces europaeiscabiei]